MIGSEFGHFHTSIYLDPLMEFLPIMLCHLKLEHISTKSNVFVLKNSD